MVSGLGEAMENYSNIWALIKDGIVVNTIIFEGDEPYFIQGLKETMDIDDIISGENSEFPPGIGMTYNYEENKFIP